MSSLVYSPVYRTCVAIDRRFRPSACSEAGSLRSCRPSPPPLGRPAASLPGLRGLRPCRDAKVPTWPSATRLWRALRGRATGFPPALASLTRRSPRGLDPFPNRRCRGGRGPAGSTAETRLPARCAGGTSAPGSAPTHTLATSRKLGLYGHRMRGSPAKAAALDPGFAPTPRQRWPMSALRTEGQLRSRSAPCVRQSSFSVIPGLPAYWAIWISRVPLLFRPPRKVHVDYVFGYDTCRDSLSRAGHRRGMNGEIRFSRFMLFICDLLKGN